MLQTDTQLTLNAAEAIISEGTSGLSLRLEPLQSFVFRIE
jgi:hypothetical protein